MERQEVAKDLIHFDKEWSAMTAKKPEEFEYPSDLEDFYVRTAELPAGLVTQYTPSLIVGRDDHQQLATGYTVGKRFRSAPVVRVADTDPVHLGHHARADCSCRICVFADVAQPGTWLTPTGSDPDAWFDLKVIDPAGAHRRPPQRRGRRGPPGPVCGQRPAADRHRRTGHSSPGS